MYTYLINGKLFNVSFSAFHQFIFSRKCSSSTVSDNFQRIKVNINNKQNMKIKVEEKVHNFIYIK